MNNTVSVPVQQLKALVRSAQELRRLANSAVPLERLNHGFESLLIDVDRLLDERRIRTREAKVRAGKVGGASKSSKKSAASSKNIQLALERRRRNIKIRKAEKLLHDERCPDCGGELSASHACTKCSADWGDWPGWQEA